MGLALQNNVDRIPDIDSLFSIVHLTVGDGDVELEFVFPDVEIIFLIIRY